MSYLEQLFGLHGQTALVTGGTRGIGQAMAIALASAGADILLVQRDESNQSTKDAIEKLGRKARIYVADLSSNDALKALTPRILADGHQVDILLNCGGIQRRHPPHEFPDADWADVLQVNLTTVFTLCRDIGAHMLSRAPDPPSTTTATSSSDPADTPPTPRHGTIINVGSLLSFQGGINVPAYAAAKGGVAQLTKALSNQWAARGVTVNCIVPGYIATDMNAALLADDQRAAAILDRIPAGRWGVPADFASTVVYLASRASGYVSGSMVTVDGGWMGR